MGNRAIIKPVDSTISLYLHWNGGRDSVDAFLKYCEMKGYRGLGQDTGYGLARLAQVVGNYFGGTMSVGLCLCDGTKDSADMIDNGIYIVKGWDIVDRIYRGLEQDEYSLHEMIQIIDKAQPKDEQLGEFLTAIPADIRKLRIGDMVLIRDNFNGKIEKHQVMGIGEECMRVNGAIVRGIPYIDKICTAYYEKDDFSRNINNYLRDGEVWISPDQKEENDDE